MRADFLNGTPTRTGNKILPSNTSFPVSKYEEGCYSSCKKLTAYKECSLKEETASFLREWAGVAGKLMAVWNASMFS